MNTINFSSLNYYLYLPTKSNPKVALAIDNPTLAQNSFRLYNPFSDKAKFLKAIYKVAFTSFNKISKIILKPKYQKQSKFIHYLEEKLGYEIISSLYFATAKDKVVLQLQTKEAQIVGYLKYPLNNFGLNHLYNEKKALEILSSKGIIENYTMYDTFQETPFLLLKPLEGHIDIVEKEKVEELLNKFKLNQAYTLAEHPRMQQIKKKLIKMEMYDTLSLLKRLCVNSSYSYRLVYEHGDFAPWNIIQLEEKYIPFDFEYFEENGLEYFDLIKYYYQIGKLLNSMKNEELILYISKQINIEEIEILLELYLIKEIILSKKENMNYEFEENMLKILEDRYEK